jgi:hypothetical protein
MKTNMLKHTLFLIFSVITFNSVKAQNNTTTFFSKLYFPFDFGFTTTSQNTFETGSLIKTGLEYRFKTTTGIFIRFNYDNRSNKFTIQENSTTNVIEGNLKFDDYLLGIGYRIRKNKVKGICLLQTGISTFEYPTINGMSNNFIINQQQHSTPSTKLTFGLEYYVANNAAFTLETGYILQTSNTVFWKNNLNVMSLSFGLTTTLF